MSEGSVNIRHKETGEFYDAVKHDGTDEQAKRITTWVNDHRGRAQYFPKGHVDFDIHQAFVLILRDDDEPEFVRRGFWVIRRVPGDSFFVIFGADLTEHFELIRDEHHRYVGDIEKAFGLTRQDR